MHRLTYTVTRIAAYREQIENERVLEVVVEFYNVVQQNVLHTTQQHYVENVALHACMQTMD